MTETVQTQSLTNAERREAIYAGEVIHVKASTASKNLVAAVISAIEAEFGAGKELRKLQFEIPGDELFQRVGKLRKRLSSEPKFQELLYELLNEQGFELTEHAVDPVRMRAVTHLGHENPLAANAYTAHRDCWYANPQAQINWWIPLFDVDETQTFAFFHEYFDKPVANNSAEFDYDEWMKTVGWQSTSGKQAVYPSAAEGSFDLSTAKRFACSAGDIVLFAASHLHQTTKNSSGLTRFSIDFRTVHLDDHASGKGAVNVDNASTGSALADYLVKKD